MPQPAQFSSIFDFFSSWYSHHKAIAAAIATLATLSVGVAMTAYANSEKIVSLEAKVSDNAKQHRIKELRYHIDALSQIPVVDMPPQIKRALDDYKKEKAYLLKPSH